MNRYLGITLGTIFSLLVGIDSALPDATLLPNAIQYFMDANGKPLSNGKVFFYEPPGTTTKTVWTTADKSVPQAQPVPLGISGRPASPIYGDGIYRQVVKDQFNNPIWDFNTASTGSGGGGGGGTATGDGDLVGTTKLWGGLTAPNQYMFTFGQAINRTTYAALFTAITQVQNVICTTGLNILSGIADTSQLPIGGKVEASCIPPGTSITAKTANSVTLTANASISTGISATFFLYGNGDGSTTFNLPDLRGRVAPGRNNMGGTPSANLISTYCEGGNLPDSTGAPCGNQSTTLVAGNLPSHTHVSPVLTDPGHVHGFGLPSPTDTLAGSGALGFTAGALALQDIGGAKFVASASTGVFLSANTGANASGLSTPFSRMMPSLTMNYIMKVTPDANSATASGVTDLQGMTGSIACGTGLTCTGNTVSASVVSTSTDSHVQDFLAGVGFTAGTSTSVTLSGVPLIDQLVSVMFDGVGQSANTWALVGNVITFNAVIPLNTQVVEVKWSSVATVSPSVTLINPVISGTATWLNALSGGVAVSTNAAATANTVHWPSNSGEIVAEITPQYLGFKCDGTVEANIIQTAVNALPSNGGIINIPSGSNCQDSGTASITKNNVTIIGAGRATGNSSGPATAGGIQNISALNYTGTAARYIDTRGVSNTTIKNLQLTYSSPSFTGALIDGSSITPGVSVLGSYLTVEGNFLGTNTSRTGAVTIIALNQHVGAIIKDNFFYHAAPAIQGATIAGLNTTTTVIGNTFSLSDAVPIFSCGSNWLVQDNVFEGSATGTASAFTNTSTFICKGMTWINNDFGDTTVATGTWIDGYFSGAVFQGNAFGSSGSPIAIAIRASSGVTIQNNYFETFTNIVDCATATTTGLTISNNFATSFSGIYLTNSANCPGTSLPGNTPQQAEPVVAPTLLNSWVNSASGVHTAGYYKVGNIVRLVGSIKNGGVNNPAFTLPVGFRPNASVFFSTPNPAAGTPSFVILVQANGDVIPQAGVNTGCALDGVSFLAEQ